nr:MAG TPA_asm: hypothetical protein [Caudoviricetes sp.]DAM83097.1 MAG TPA: hypothetical protein [Caudoviricetes sp.]
MTRLPRRGRCLYKFKTKPLIFHFSSQAAPNGGKCPKGERGAVSKKGRIGLISPRLCPGCMVFKRCSF